MTNREVATGPIEQRDWDRARRAAFVEDMLGVFSNRSRELLSFEDVRQRLRLHQKTYKGVHEIDLSQIAGSVGRYKDFTRSFLPRRENMRERWKRVNAVGQEIGFPPIEVYRVGEAYFVLDGNHRVSVARQMKLSTIEAHIWEFDTSVQLSSQADMDEVLLKAEYIEFCDETNINDLCPGHEIHFTLPGQYREITVQMDIYRRILEKIDQEQKTFDEAVVAWYDMVYTPCIQAIREQGVLDYFPGRTEADLFVFVWLHNEELKQQGIASYAKAAEEVKRREASGLRGLWNWLTGWLRRS
ncbi:MAG: hypothetical protein GYB68_07095 [Chloroflexi bacterium]|nr:hypothetical protein [Chloroflexota bacterium]